MRRLTLAAFLALVSAFMALPTAAADHDEAYYQRTATAPPGTFLLGPTINYTDKLGVGGVFGYDFGMIELLGSVSAVQLKGDDGTTEFRKFCQTFKVPYTVGDRTATEVAVTVLFRLKKYK